MEGQGKVDAPVRIIGSRELHQRLPSILTELQDHNVRYVLTVHGRPRAVLVGAEPFLQIAADRVNESDVMVSLQLSALLGETSDSPINTKESDGSSHSISEKKVD